MLQTRDTVALASGYMVPTSGEEVEEEVLRTYRSPLFAAQSADANVKHPKMEVENRFPAGATNQRVELSTAIKAARVSPESGCSAGKQSEVMLARGRQQT